MDVVQSKEWEIDRQQCLGKGAYAQVFKGKWIGKEVAVKRILSIDFIHTDREQITMENLEHPNVLKLFAVKEDENFKYLFLELCVATVEDYCHERYDGEMPAEAKALYQMADGLSYIHSKNLVHRDISTGNVLISQTSGSEPVLKISDFGFCKPASQNGSYSISKSYQGTRHFLAPEILFLMHDSVEQPYTKCKNTSDIFSLGCLFFVFLTKSFHPFCDSASNTSIFSIPVNITNNVRFLDPLDKNHYARPLIEKMTEKDPLKRPDIQKVKDTLSPHL